MNIHKTVISLSLLCIVIFTLSCGGDGSDDSASLEWSANGTASAYVTIDNIHYKTIHWYTSDVVKIFYTIQLAKKDHQNKPVFIIFNGGPGAATTSNLFAMNTAQYTLCRDFVEEGELNALNANAWNDMANLIYIDAPNTGYSYNEDINANPCAWGARDTYLSGRNFNPLTDAAQVTRAILRILKLSELQNNKVVIVGESYGGVRSTVILHMLLFYNSSHLFKDLYQDNDLQKEIQAYYDDVFDANGQTVAPAQIAQQFGYNILIQPQLTGSHHNDLTTEVFCPASGTGLLDKIAAEKNIDGGRFPRCIDQPCKPWGNYHTKECMLACNAVTGSDFTWASLWLSYNDMDPYNISKPASWSDDLDAFAVQSLTTPNEIAKIMGLDDQNMDNFPKTIRNRSNHSYHLGRVPGLSVETADSYELNDEYYYDLAGSGLRYIFANQSKEDNIQPELINTLTNYYGIPQNCKQAKRCCDSYYKSWDMAIAISNYIYPKTQPDNEIYGRMFLYNLAVLQDVMITNAAQDMIIYSATLPPSFKAFSEVSDVKIDADSHQFTIFYQTEALDALIPTPPSKTIKWPNFENSGHAVSVTQPKELHDRIQAFLIDNNLFEPMFAN